MNLAAIFQVLEHLNDFEITGYGGHFGQNFFQAKHLQGRTFDGLSLHSETISPIIRQK